MYSQIKSCVKFNGQFSDFYNCYKGLVQGGGLVAINILAFYKRHRNGPVT